MTNVVMQGDERGAYVALDTSYVERPTEQSFAPPWGGRLDRKPEQG